MSTLKEHRQASKKARKAERRTGKRIRDNKIALIRRPMWQSTAWRSLKGRDVQVYLHALMEHNPTKHEGHIFCLPISQLRYLGSKNSITKSLNNLVEHGFLDIIQYGGLYKGATKYTLSDRWETWEPPDEK
ncbi:MAG: hypothetical protein J3T61_02590 [Candidatus Brocadiales bacterium]|nr:hypothetical protein [Candidatus Bathyanammoxibius sp.]